MPESIYPSPFIHPLSVHESIYPAIHPPTQTLRLHYKENAVHDLYEKNTRLIRGSYGAHKYRIICWKIAKYFNVRTGGTISYRYPLKVNLYIVRSTMKNLSIFLTKKSTEFSNAIYLNTQFRATESLVKTPDVQEVARHSTKYSN
jgi:hypothetical protein